MALGHDAKRADDEDFEHFDDLSPAAEGSPEEQESLPRRDDSAAAPLAATPDGLRVLCVGSNMLQYGLVGVLREVAGELDVRWARTVGERSEEHTSELQ